MNNPDVERKLGIERYCTRTSGIGGVIRSSPDDFIVHEVLRGYGPADNPAFPRTPPTKKGRYLLATLEKRGWDTFPLLRKISQQMQINEKRIRIAGIKDAKAHTIQYMTLENIPPSMIKKVKIRDVKITPLSHIEEPVNSTYLLGNHFRIAIKEVRDAKNVVDDHICRIRDEINSREGIANFYGHQRFGTIRPITHLVGRCLVKREFEKAVLTYLTATGEKEEPTMRRLREGLKETRDYRQFLREVPKKYLYERLLAERLTKKPDDYIGAI
ncbi:tRNA pseudouridine(13) synthase TruD, partial [[Eubacterium] cellulosolvens]